MMRWSWALTVSAFLWSGSAAAFCRTTTCDTADAKQQCQVDTTSQCTLTGSPLYWASGCVTVNVQRDGAPNARITAAQAEASVQRAFDTWLGVDCNGAPPSLQLVLGAPVPCDRAEYSTDHHNANIVIFREDRWPYVGAADALGVTWLHFDDERAPGQLWDADIEINAVTEPLSVGEPKRNQADLDSVLTHEIGHLLGLGHTLDGEATMAAGYVPGSTALRSLAPDDIRGICAIYPPSRALESTSCEPRHGFSALCADEQPPFVEPDQPEEEEPVDRVSDGCTVASGRTEQAPLGLALIVFAWLRRRRSASR